MMGLLENAKNRSSYSGEKYFFKGDLLQMSTAKIAAKKLGVCTGVEWGNLFVMNEKDYKKVTQHIIKNRLDGWWHYVTREEYLKMKG